MMIENLQENAEKSENDKPDKNDQNKPNELSTSTHSRDLYRQIIVYSEYCLLCGLSHPHTHKNMNAETDNNTATETKNTALLKDLFKVPLDTTKKHYCMWDHCEIKPGEKIIPLPISFQLCDIKSTEARLKTSSSKYGNKCSCPYEYHYYQCHYNNEMCPLANNNIHVKTSSSLSNKKKRKLNLTEIDSENNNSSIYEDNVVSLSDNNDNMIDNRTDNIVYDTENKKKDYFSDLFEHTISGPDRKFGCFGGFCSDECSSSYNQTFFKGIYSDLIKLFRYHYFDIPTSDPLADAPPPCIINKYPGGVMSIEEYRLKYTNVVEKMKRVGIERLQWDHTTTQYSLIVPHSAKFNISDAEREKIASSKNNINPNHILQKQQQQRNKDNDDKIALSVRPIVKRGGGKKREIKEIDNDYDENERQKQIEFQKKKLHEEEKLKKKKLSIKYQHQGNELKAKPCIVPRVKVAVDPSKYKKTQSNENNNNNLDKTSSSSLAYSDYIRNVLKNNHCSSLFQNNKNNNSSSSSSYTTSQQQHGVESIQPEKRQKRARNSLVLPIHAISTKTFDKKMPRTPSATEQSYNRVEKFAEGARLSTTTTRIIDKPNTEYKYKKNIASQKQLLMMDKPVSSLLCMKKIDKP